MKTAVTGELRMNWQVLAVSQILGFVLALLLTLGWGYFGTRIGHRSLPFACISAYSLLMVPRVLAGDRSMGGGARPWVVYSLLLLINPAVSFSAAFLTLQLCSYLFHLSPPLSREEQWAFIGPGIHLSVGCGLCMLALMNRRTADRMLEKVRSAELRRIELNRQLIESRRATAEAQMDPARLLAELGRVKQGLDHDEADAESRINDLILTLRATLRRTVAVASDTADT